MKKKEYVEEDKMIYCRNLLMMMIIKKEIKNILKLPLFALELY